jgi:hypothetical protein
MRFLCIVKATELSEKGLMPENAEKLFAEMGKFNEEMARAGVMLAGDGLKPSSQGARINFKGNQRSVTDGPFSETKELIAGFWIIQAKSLEEAVEWMKRSPHPHPGTDTNIEIRPFYEAEDFSTEFGVQFSPEEQEREQRTVKMMEKNKQR